MPTVCEDETMDDGGSRENKAGDERGGVEEEGDEDDKGEDDDVDSDVGKIQVLFVTGTIVLSV